MYFHFYEYVFLFLFIFISLIFYDYYFIYLFIYLFFFFWGGGGCSVCSTSYNILRSKSIEKNFFTWFFMKILTIKLHGYESESVNVRYLIQTKIIVTSILKFQDLKTIIFNVFLLAHVFFDDAFEHSEDGEAVPNSFVLRFIECLDEAIR